VSIMNRRSMFVLCISIAIGAGCFRRGTLPPMEVYQLIRPVPSSAADPASSDNRSASTIAVAPFDAPGIYGDRSIVFRLDSGETRRYGAYTTREWGVPLGEMVGAIVASRLAADIGEQRVVYDPPSRRGHTYLLRGTIREFEEINRGMDVFAAVRLDGTLVRAADDSVVWRGTAAVERPAGRTRAMAEVVAALSAAAQDAAMILSTGTASVLQGQSNIAPAAAAPARRP